MNLKDIDIKETLDKAKTALKNEKNISQATKTIFELLIVLMTLMINKLGLNSSNSSKPPSTDQNRKKNNRKKSDKPRGGQNGHNGTTLEPISDPDEIKELSIDRRKLPKNKRYKSGGHISRQVIDIKISRIITEYRAEILVDDDGIEYVAEFPKGVTRPIQYGTSVKAHATYLSTYQLIPYERIQEQFRDEYNIPTSTGSIYNFNAEASNKLVELGFEKAVKQALTNADVAHADETGINLDGKRIWLHNLSNNDLTWFEPHEKRGSKAMNDIGIIPHFTGVLCHDHWKPYYTYHCKHSLCNAHHLRELKRAFEQDGQKWAEAMRLYLIELNKEVDETGNGKLETNKANERREQYRKILESADIECPEPEPTAGKKRIKRSKARNLLARLRDYENDVLLFMIDPLVPFTNNQGERDIRMTKVQQKISGCFRSMEGAVNFCRVRSYLSSCKKNGVSASDALEMLFNGKLPGFIQKLINSS
jgi:transposase